LCAPFLILDRNWWIFSHTLRKVQATILQGCEIFETQVIKICIWDTLYVSCILYFAAFKMYFVFQLHFNCSMYLKFNLGKTGFFTQTHRPFSLSVCVRTFHSFRMWNAYWVLTPHCEFLFRYFAVYLWWTLFLSLNNISVLSWTCSKSIKVTCI